MNLINWLGLGGIGAAVAAGGYFIARELKAAKLSGEPVSGGPAQPPKTLFPPQPAQQFPPPM